MFFRKSKYTTIERDPETIQMWKDKYNRAIKENSALRKQLNDIEQYKNDYEELIASAKKIKERYEDLLINEERLYQDYKDELDRTLQLANNK